MPFVAIDEDATLELISLTGDAWFLGIALILWFAYGSLRLAQAESRMDDDRITCGMYFKKVLMVPFVPFLLDKSTWNENVF
jgi:hypothetical protein